MSDFAHPRVGVGVFVRHNGKYLLQHRIKEHGQGTWSLIGGHLDKGETLEDCARRETLEEIGITITECKFLGVSNDVFPESGKHYLTVFMLADVASPEYENREPEKHDDYGWYALEDFPQNLLPSLAGFMKKPYFTEARP